MENIKQQHFSLFKTTNIFIDFSVFFKKQSPTVGSYKLKKILLLILFTSIFNSSLFAQQTSVSYPGTTGQINYNINNVIAPLTPTIVGSLPTERTNVTTIAGSGASGFSDGSSVSPRYYNPSGVAVATSGNVYVADSQNHCIRKISPSGFVTTFAGTGVAGFANGDITVAQFNTPYAVAVDASENVYVTESLSYAVRKITAAGVVSTIAGNPNTSGFLDGQSTVALFSSPKGITVDGSGNIYIADANNNRIRKISNTGAVTTIAGDGTSGYLDAQGTNAKFNNPTGIAISSSGTVYVGDSSNNRIRSISSSGLVTTFAGDGVPGFINGQGTAAEFNSPHGLGIDTSGNVYVSDYANNSIRKITNTGLVTTLSGTGSNSFINGLGTVATFKYPEAVTIDGSGTVYVADVYNNSIRKTINTGDTTTYSGSSSKGLVNGQGGVMAMFNTPTGVAVTSAGITYVIDDVNPCIRMISSSGVISTIAGNPTTAGFADGQGASAQFNNPKGIAVDAAGNIYVADAYNNRIRKITSNGLVTTIAGDGTSGYLDGQGTAAKFASPSSLTLDASGNIYVTDMKNYRIRKISTSGLVTTIAGTGVSGFLDGAGTVAKFKNPQGIAFDNATGTIYVSDTGNQRIRKITSDGMVSTFAGSTAGYLDDQGTAAQFYNPIGIMIDASSNLYVGDYYNSVVRKITNTGLVSTYAGNGSSQYTDGLGITIASFYFPVGLAKDASGNVYVADSYTQRIRKIVPLAPYSITPALPKGISFNTATGVLSGTPTVLKEATTYTIVASNYYYTATTTINFAVIDSTTQTTPSPTAASQTFCNAGTVANLVATGTALKWYTVAIGGTALSSTTTLTTGNYYVSQTINAVESARTLVAVTINAINIPTAVAQTFCNTATVSNLVASGTALKWYNVATNGTALASTTALTTGNYYVSQTVNSCESNRTLVTITINTTVAPSASAQTFSNPSTVANLVATGTALNWYTLSSGGTALASTTALSSGNYYVSQTLNSCESNRTLVAVTVNIPTAPSAPIASSQTFCNAATIANLAATGTALKWYNVATSGTALASTSALVSGNYYVSQTLNSIESARTLITVTVNTTAAPTASAQTFNTAATVANLVASGTALNWYTLSSGGTALASTTALSSGNYYVSQTLNSCESSRTLVAVTVNIPTAPSAPIASSQTFCNAATVTNLVATGTALKWYNVATSGTALASTSALVSGNYYVSQTINAIESKRTLVAVTINAINAPTASAQTFCNSATVVNLVATGTALNWYTVSSGGTALASTTALTTGNYYVSQTVNSCESNRTLVAVTVNTTVAPTASSQTFSNPSTVANLVATGTALKWYNIASGGTALASTTALSSGNYYVSQTLNSCESNRTLAAVTVNIPTAPSAPIASSQTFCNAATVTNLVATGTALKWYTVATSGTALASTSALVSGNYYVSQTLNSIESARTLVVVTIISISAPTAAAQTFCNAATALDLTASGTALKWYNDSTGGTTLTSTTNLTTKDYYVSQTLNACESTRTKVNVIINKVSPIIQPTNISICTAVGSKATVTIGTTNPNCNYNWQYRVVTATTTGAWIDITTTSAGAVYSNYTTATLGINRATTALPAAGTQYRVLVTGNCGDITSDIAYLTIIGTAKAGTITSATSVCEGNAITFTLGGTVGTSIQWQSALNATSTFVDIPGATETTFTLTNAAATSNKSYRVIVSNSCTNSTATSAVKTIKVDPISVAGTITGGGEVCFGSATKNTLKVIGYVGTIQWESSIDGGATWANVPSGTTAAPSVGNSFTTISTGKSSSYIVYGFTQSALFRVTVKSSTCSSATSDDTECKVTRAYATRVKAENQTVCSGTSTTLILDAGYSGTIKWMKSTNFGTTPTTATWSTVTGTTPSVSTGTIAVTTWYKATLTIGGTCTSETTPISVSVYAKPVAKSISSPTSSGTATVPLCVSTSKVLNITSGYTADTIQWEKAIVPLTSTTTPSATDYTPINGATAASYTVRNGSTGKNYFRAKFTLGGCTNTAVYSTSFIVYYNDCTVIEKTEDPTSNPFTVVTYPNPFTDTFKLNVSTSSEEKVALAVYDMTGKFIEQREIEPSDLSEFQVGEQLPSGIYNVIVTQGTEIRTQRVIKK